METGKSLACNMVIEGSMAIYELAEELKAILGDIRFDRDETGDFEEVLTYRSRFLGHEIVLQDAKVRNRCFLKIYPCDTPVRGAELIDIFEVVCPRLRNRRAELSIKRLPLITEIK